MIKQQLTEYLTNKEQELGLQAGELLALWQQESGGSTDPNLKGVYLPKHGTSAMGPFQVMPNLHPGFPADGDVFKQADFAANLYAGGGDTPEARMRRYYGTGTPPAGHPTTDQYVNQVKARMPSQPSPQAQQPTPQPLTQQAPEPSMQPQTFTPNYIPVPEPINYEDLPQVPRPRELTGVQKWLADPLTQMGAAIMAASGSPLGAPIGYGVASAASGLGEAQKAENDLYELQLKREQAKRQLMTESRKGQMDAFEWNQKQKDMEYLWKLAEDYDRQGKPMEAAKIRAGIKPGPDPSSGLTPQFLMSPDGKTAVQRIYKSDGTFIDTPLGDMRPANISPETQSQVAAAKAGGVKVGEANAQKEIDYPKIIATANQQINLLDQLKDHPGEKYTTGFLLSEVPKGVFSGTSGADYIGIMDQILGGAFMRAYEGLRGTGAISEIEGAKATAAMTRLSRAQTREDRQKELNTLREIMQAGIVEAEKRARNPYAGGQAAPQGAPQAPRPSRQGWSAEEVK